MRKQVERTYDKVIEHKNARLEELKRTAKYASTVAEMPAIVDEGLREGDNRIEQTMRRFTDPRLRPGCRQPEGGHVPVLGASQNVSIGYVPVTNEDYAKFLQATGRPPPKSEVEAARARPVLRRARDGGAPRGDGRRSDDLAPGDRAVSNATVSATPRG